tara:strand:+ start:579 stop:761 length:183 start_codon:yes stop_codon:yes gene_type:complete
VTKIKRKRNKLQQRRADFKRKVRQHQEYQVKMRQYTNQVINEGLQLMRMNAHNPTATEEE